MKPLYLYIMMVLISCSLNGQIDTLKKKPFLKLYAFGLNAGPLLNTVEAVTGNNLMKMSPENRLLQQDYNSLKLKYNDQNEGFDLGLQTSFIFYRRSKKTYNNKQELRIGVHAQASQSANLTYEREERVRFDTLVSHTSPQEFYIDTVKTHSYYLGNEQSNYLVDISHIIFLKPQNKIFSLYVGYGLGYGRIFQNYVNIRVRYSERFEDQNGDNYYYNKSSVSSSSGEEQTRLKQTNLFQGALNGGILIRFSNIKKNFVRRFAINVDGKAGLRLFELPNVEIQKQVFFTINFGLKIYLNREAYK